MAMKFSDLTRDLPEVNWKELFGGQKELPLEPEKLIEAHRKNLEAWAAAQRIITQGFQTITKRQAEILRDNMAEASGLLRSMVSERGFDPSKQAEHLKSALETQRNYLREVTELMAKIQTDAFGVIRDRFKEGIGELGEAKSAKKESPEMPKAAAASNPPPAAKKKPVPKKKKK